MLFVRFFVGGNHFILLGFYNVSIYVLLVLLMVFYSFLVVFYFF